MYSDMSKRVSSTPMQKASCRATSVLPTPVGPENRKLPIQRPERVTVIAADTLRWNARDLGDDLLDLGLADHLLLPRLGQNFLRRASFVDDVDGLVRQMPVVDESRGELRRSCQRGRRVLHAVVLLEARLETLEILNRFGDGRLRDVDLLKAPRQRVIFFEDDPIFVVGCRPDALERTTVERRLEQIRRVERTA